MVWINQHQVWVPDHPVAIKHGKSGGSSGPAHGAPGHFVIYQQPSLKESVSAAVQGSIYAGIAAYAAESFIESCIDGDAVLAQCFPAGTLVATPRGLFPIESIKAGDEVWSYDLLRGCWCPRHVLKTYVTDHDGTSATITEAGEDIEATYLHPFWVVHGEDLASRPIREHLARAPEGATTSGRWVDAGDIRVGDELLLRDWRFMPVQAIRHQPYHDKVYNFHVEDLQCYAVGRNSVLVHNQNGDNYREESFEKMARGNNQAANRAFKYICNSLGLTVEEAEQLHEVISGENYILEEIRAIAESMFGKGGGG